MKKKLLAILILFGLMAVSFLQPYFEKKYEKENLLEFETRITEYKSIYSDELSNELSSDQIYFIPLMRFLEMNFTVNQGETEEGILNYWYFNQNLSKELDCTGFKNSSSKIRCLLIKADAGAENTQIVRDLQSVKVSSYRDLLLKRDVCGSVGNNDFSLYQNCLILICKEAQDYSENHVPDNLCEKKWQADLDYICFNDETGLREIVKEKPISLREFSCYYGAYHNLRPVEV